jgi:hypothetical protein
MRRLAPKLVSARRTPPARWQALTSPIGCSTRARQTILETSRLVMWQAVCDGRGGRTRDAPDALDALDALDGGWAAAQRSLPQRRVAAFSGAPGPRGPPAQSAGTPACRGEARAPRRSGGRRAWSSGGLAQPSSLRVDPWGVSQEPFLASSLRPHEPYRMRGVSL